MSRIITPLLRRIVGRIKENMSTIQITVAMALIPLGFILLVWSAEKQDISISFLAVGIIILGMISWFASLFTIRKEQRKDREEREVFLNLIKAVSETMLSIKNEIKSLRRDLRGRKK